MSNPPPPVGKIDLEGDSSSVGLRWEKWKRSLKIYSEAADVTCALKKRANLLLLGGAALQEIFYNLPGANAEKTEKNDVFEIAIKNLDDHFLPKQNKTYERHIFRLIKQEESESFEKFLIRLRDQAGKCKFDKPEDSIIDQIIERCSSSELRKKILILGDEVTLDKVIIEANTLQIVNQQLESYEQKEICKTTSVNAITTKNRNSQKEQRTEKKCYEERKGSKCGRCGSALHNSQDLTCPAKGRKCNGCGKLGHYQRCCKTKSA